MFYCGWKQPPKNPLSFFQFAGWQRKKVMISNLTGYLTAFTPEPHQDTTRAITWVSPLVRRLKMHLEKCPLRWSNWCLTEIWKYNPRFLYYFLFDFTSCKTVWWVFGCHINWDWIKVPGRIRVPERTLLQRNKVWVEFAVKQKCACLCCHFIQSQTVTGRCWQ